MLSASAQETAPEVIFNAHWLKGEYQMYELYSQSYLLQKEDTLEQESMRCMLDVVVKDSSYQHFQLEWRLYDFQYQGRHYLNSRWIQSLDELSVVCRTSPVGVLQEIREPEALRKTLDKSIDELFKHYDGLPTLEARETLYAFRAALEEWIFASVMQFYQLYGLAYRLGEVVEVPDQMGLEDKSFPVKRFKKLEYYEDGIATLVTATVPDTVFYTADSTRLQIENSSAHMMHVSTGWPVYGYELMEYGIDTWKEGLLNIITLKQE